jgi:putative ABC transport system permease protein
MTVSVAQAVSFGRIGEIVRPLFMALQVAMLLVLLIACANVAGVLLGRTAVRQREIAVRLATGASRSRLVRQLVTEGLVVAVTAGVVAAVVTTYALAAASRFVADMLSRQGGGTVALTITPDAAVLVYVAGISIVTGVLFTLAPALQASRPDLVSALKSGTGSSEGSNRQRLRGWLIAGQIAMSVALLITATGLARSASELVKADPGFRSTSVLTVWLTNPEELGLPAARAREIEMLVRDRLRSLPGVQTLSVASRLPLGGNVSTSAMLPEERAADPATRDVATRYPYAFVSEDYFSTFGIPLVRGRTFTAQEVRDSAKVAVISDSMARVLWPKGDAIGKQLAMGTTPQLGFSPGGAALSGTAQIIGVVRDVRGLTIAGPDVGDVYLPKLTNGWSSRIVLGVNGDMARIERDVAVIVREVEPALPVSVLPMNAVVSNDASIVTARAGAGILALIGALGLLLAGVGVYGMVSYSLRQQRREIGIRMALGAQPYQVLAAAVRGTVRWIVRGIIAGVVFGVAAIKVTNAVLQGVSISASVLDPGALLVVPVVIGGFALLAAFLSGRKAALMDPAVVLRTET